MLLLDEGSGSLRLFFFCLSIRLSFPVSYTDFWQFPEKIFQVILNEGLHGGYQKKLIIKIIAV